MKKTTKVKSKKALPLYKDAKQPVEVRVKDLIKRMTVEEKMMQLNQYTIGPDVNPNNVGGENKFNPIVGSILSFYRGTKERNMFQRIAVEETRLGIPIIWGFDVIHGWRTCMPVPLAQACSFNPELTEKGARVAALECYNDGGVDWTFSPMLEVCHDPRWGRCVEGYGEDPYTNGVFAAACVKGYQGHTEKDWKKPGYIAACLKHFVGYSASEGGRDYTYTDISNRALWEWYLPPFKAGVDAGARTLMSSFNDIAGVPAVANSYTQTEILRNRWGFTGFVVSDWSSIQQLEYQGFTKDSELKALASLLAGNDMDMVDNEFACIPKLIEDGKLKMSELNRAVERVLRVKFEMGLFEHPYAPELPVEETCLLPEYKAVALDAARETMVLLKNDNEVLPFNPNKVKKIALIGPCAKDFLVHRGEWSALVQGDSKHGSTIYDELKKALPDTEIVYAQGAEFEEDSTKLIPKAVKVAKGADLVILAIGERGDMSGEYHSRVNIDLPGMQKDLVEAITKVGKPTIALVTAGRPIAFPKAMDKVDSILFMWQSGYGAAQAAVEMLLGKVNPSGKLAMTFPREVGQVPIYYNRHHTCRIRIEDYRNSDIENGPKYDFGYGLSYSKFDYSDLVIKKTKKGISAEVTVTNNSKYDGKETVIWYISDPEAVYTQPLRRVIAFEKAFFKAGESKKIKLNIDIARDLTYTTDDGQKILESGDFILSASEKVKQTFVLELADDSTN